MNTFRLFAGILFASSAALAQTPNWTVVVTPTLSPLPIGLCGAVHLKLLDPVTKDVPRNPQGYRITMADFDLTVSGTVVAGHQIDATHFETCGCQNGATGTSATITAKYPAQSLPAAARVAGVSFQKTATVTLGEVKGPVNPPSCITLASNTPESAPSPVSAGVISSGTIGPGTPRTPQPASTPPVATATPPGPQGATFPAQPPASTAPAAITPLAAVPETRTPVSVAPPAPAAPPTGAPAAVAPAAAPVPVNPNGFVAFQGQPGEVVLQWNPVADAEFYVLFGPGLEQGGQRVEQGQGAILAQGSNKIVVGALEVPGGMQEWAVASYYAGNVSTPAAAFTRVSLNVAGVVAATPPPSAASTPPPVAAPASGKYLVTITGIRAYLASADDLLSRDGTGDEIYAAAYVRRYDRRDGTLIDATMRQSASHGDNFHFAGQRLQAGSRTATGGIQDGDMIPGPALVAMRSVPPQDVTFPMRLWEGTMADGIDALVISPSLWEQDVGAQFFTQWQQFQTNLNITIFAKQGLQDQISQKAFGSVIFGMSGNDTNTAGMSHGRLVVDTVLMVFGGTVPILSIITTTADRPLGIQQNGRDVTVLPNHTVVLTREIIEQALASPPLGGIPSPVANGPSIGLLGTMPAISRVGVIAPKPGIIVVQFIDRGINGTAGLPERPAVYEMYIQAERMP